MVGLRIGNQQANGQPDTIFECEFCASRHSARVITYNWFGYPVCPVCEYDHGPREPGVSSSGW